MKEKNNYKKGIIGNILIVCFLLIMNMQCLAADISDETLEAVENRLTTALENYETIVDLRDLQIQVDMYSDKLSPEYKQLLNLADKVVEESASFELRDHKVPYCSVNFNTQPSEGNDDPYQLGANDVTEMTFTYDSNYCPMDEAPDAALFEEIKKTASENYENALACVNEDMSDVEKALVLYDYIVLASNYPEGNGYDDEGMETFDNRYYSEINLFYEGISVCMANANAYACLLADVGIDAVTVDSIEMNHTWTMLKIDGNWYHADPTWDDPRYYTYTSLGDHNEDFWDLGAITHNYFLKSDEEFLELNHYGWEFSKNFGSEKVKSTPKAEENGAWNEAFFSDQTPGGNWSSFNYIDEVWYFLDSNQSRIVEYKNEEYNYPDYGNDIKYVQGDGEKLYICRRNEIIFINPASGQEEVVLSADNYGEDAFISEMRVANGDLDAVILIPDNSDSGYITQDFTMELPEIENAEEVEEDVVGEIEDEKNVAEEESSQEETEETAKNETEKKEKPGLGIIFLIGIVVVGGVLLVNSRRSKV